LDQIIEDVNFLNCPWPFKGIQTRGGVKMNEIQEQIKDYIVTKFMFDRSALGPDEDLLNQGIVDSMGILQLVNHLEETFGIRINDEDIVPDNFRSLRTLAELVMQKNGVKTVA
jgi:acyl carrier protein